MSGSITLRDVTVVDPRDGSLAPAMDVTVAGERIVSVVPTGGGTAGGTADGTTNGGTVVDAAGQYVVPGYLDMHAHPLGPKDPAGSLELMLANGITGFRQMAGSAKLLEQRRAGTLPIPPNAPELLLMPGEILNPLNAGTAETAVATVRRQKANGADFIKVGFVTPPVFFAAQAEASRLGIPIVGHLPTGIDVVAASRGGMKSIEHLGPGVGILAGCSTAEVEIVERLASAPSRLKAPPFKVPFAEKIAARVIRKLVVNPSLMAGDVDVEVLRRAIDTFDEDKALALAARFVADGTWQVPTLIRERTSELSDDPEYRDDPNLRYVAEPTLRQWREASGKFAALAAPVKATFRDAYALRMRITGLFDRAGVKILAGSDSCGAGWEVPGFALHQEFDQLAKAGLSPLRVLQTVTSDAAAFLDAGDTRGAVEPGKAADLVLLGANPLERTDHLHDIRGVLRAGRFHSRDDLEAIKGRVAAARSVT
ncbi:amidohydrolase family protein [Catenulispora yoronensis]|uniref:Amidohydrolase family protein n=1 Tax=Catenulispora yoronensis TaxID=450799 RepID=A0ABN2U6J4_9ACTN